MDVLAGLFAIWGVVFLIGALLGLLVPSIFKDRKTGKVPSRWHLLLGGVVAAMVAFTITVAIAPQKSEVAGLKVSTAPEPIQVTSAADVAGASSPKSNATSEKLVSLGMTPEQFRKSFNSIVGQINDSYRTAEFEVQSGEVNDVFTRALGKNVAIVGTVNKRDGSIRSLIVTVSGGDKDIAKPIAVLLAATQALNPNVSKEKNSKVVLDMFQKSIAEIETGKPFENTVGDLHYTAAASRFTGLLFSVSKEEG